MLDARNVVVHDAVDTVTIIDGVTGDILKSSELTKYEIHHNLTYDGRLRSFYISNPKEGNM